MVIILGEVGCGKTKKMLEKAHETNAVILTHSDYRAKRLLDKADAYGLFIREPLVIGNKLPEGETYIIDSLDEVLREMLKSDVIGCTISTESSFLDSIQ